MARMISDDIRMYGSLLGLPERECEAMIHGASTTQQIACARDLRERYRKRYPPTTEDQDRSGLEQIDWWQSTGAVEQFVYFVQSGDDGPVKIGIAKNPLDRLGALQTGNHQDLHIRHVVPGDRALETSLHHRFKDALIRGEWFGLAYLNLILTFADAMAREHIWMYEIGQEVPSSVIGARTPMFPSDIENMHRDLAELIRTFGYTEGSHLSRGGKREVDQFMERWELAPDEVAEQVKVVCKKFGITPKRDYKPPRRRAYRLSPTTRPT